MQAATANVAAKMTTTIHHTETSCSHSNTSAPSNRHEPIRPAGRRERERILAESGPLALNTGLPEVECTSLARGPWVSC
jgi:hypothetical protein